MLEVSLKFILFFSKALFPTLEMWYKNYNNPTNKPGFPDPAHCFHAVTWSGER